MVETHLLAANWASLNLTFGVAVLSEPSFDVIGCWVSVHAIRNIGDCPRSSIIARDLPCMASSSLKKSHSPVSKPNNGHTFSNVHV